ncbi:hypothetical protein ACSQPN_003177 [Pseudomonas aeruginosa]|nr:hypothetical protein [Pseudomonas aeruginosa]MBX5565623.1 hypothetical protein [Pseudomonas aeruginosa]
MHNDDNDDIYQASRRETLLTLVISGLTLATLIAAGYLTPSLLAIAAR